MHYLWYMQCHCYLVNVFCTVANYSTAIVRSFLGKYPQDIDGFLPRHKTWSRQVNKNTFGFQSSIFISMLSHAKLVIYFSIVSMLCWLRNQDSKQHNFLKSCQRAFMKFHNAPTRATGSLVRMTNITISHLLTMFKRPWCIKNRFLIRKFREVQLTYLILCQLAIWLIVPHCSF